MFHFPSHSYTHDRPSPSLNLDLKTPQTTLAPKYSCSVSEFGLGPDPSEILSDLSSLSFRGSTVWQLNCARLNGGQWALSTDNQADGRQLVGCRSCGKAIVSLTLCHKCGNERVDKENWCVVYDSRTHRSSKMRHYILLLNLAEYYLDRWEDAACWMPKIASDNDKSCLHVLQQYHYYCAVLTLHSEIDLVQTNPFVPVGTMGLPHMEHHHTSIGRSTLKQDWRKYANVQERTCLARRLWDHSSSGDHSTCLDILRSVNGWRIEASLIKYWQKETSTISTHSAVHRRKCLSAQSPIVLDVPAQPCVPVRSIRAEACQAAQLHPNISVRRRDFLSARASRLMMLMRRNRWKPAASSNGSVEGY